MKEYGGYLPLELHSGNEWYSERSVSGMGVARFNSGRTALWAAMKQLGAKRVVLPAYYCPSVVDSLQNDGFSTITYPVGKDLLPVLEGYKLYDDDALLLVNYFGLLDEPLRSIASRFRKVVIDDALAFFSEPLNREGIINVYSCRKFFGVADGAYAVGVGVKQPALERDVSSPHASHLLQSIEYGTNGAYALSLENERHISDKHLAMSRLTQRILESIDYRDIVRRRRSNFCALDCRLADFQGLSLSLGENNVPSAYPFLSTKPLRTKLVKRHVYVPRMWENWIGDSCIDKNCNEYLFSNYLVSLPIDQRYDEKDMSEVADIVLAELEE